MEEDGCKDERKARKATKWGEQWSPFPPSFSLPSPISSPHPTPPISLLSLSLLILGVWELACPALSMLSRRQSARKLFVQSGGVGYVVSALNRLGEIVDLGPRFRHDFVLLWLFFVLLSFLFFVFCSLFFFLDPHFFPSLLSPSLHLIILSPPQGANGNAQQIYELNFILWTLSLGCEEKDLGSFLSAGAIRVLFDLISAAPTRKVKYFLFLFLFLFLLLFLFLFLFLFFLLR